MQLTNNFSDPVSGCFQCVWNGTASEHGRQQLEQAVSITTGASWPSGTFPQMWLQNSDWVSDLQELFSLIDFHKIQYISPYFQACPSLKKFITCHSSSMIQIPLPILPFSPTKRIKSTVPILSFSLTKRIKSLPYRNFRVKIAQMLSPVAIAAKTYKFEGQTCEAVVLYRLEEPGGDLLSILQHLASLFLCEKLTGYHFKHFRPSQSVLREE